MTQDDWKQYQRVRVAGCELGAAVVVSSDRAIYRAAGADSDLEKINAGAGAEVFVTLFDGDEQSAAERVNRYLEATFFQHPNLTKVFAAGVLEQNRAIAYAVTESFETTLSSPDAVPQSGDGLDLEALRPVLIEVAEALSWLHSQHLVVCALRPDSVVCSGGTWKLADFSELRIAGKHPPEETRRLMIRRELYAPPEAYEGIVSPAWDAWSLGLLLQNLFASNARSTGRNPATIPADSADVLGELVDTDPAQRLSAAEFAKRLRNLRAPAAPPVAPAPAPRAAPVRAYPINTPINTPIHASVHTAAEEPRPAEPEVISDDKIHSRSDHKTHTRTIGMAALVLAACAMLAFLYGRSNDRPHVAVRTGDTVSPAPPNTSARGHVIAMAPKNNREVPRSSPVENSGVAKSEISALLERWVQATQRRDPSRQASLYAPVVDEFYGRRNVTADEVRRFKARAFAEVGGARQFSIGDVRFDLLGPDRATVSFLKTWDSPTGHFASTTREEMVVRRVDGAWKISGERELSKSAAGGDGNRRITPVPGTGEQYSGAPELERRNHFAGNQ